MFHRGAARSLARTTAYIHPSLALLSRRTLASLAYSHQASRITTSKLSECRHQHRIASSFHTSVSRNAQPPTADALMESLTELYSTARDEFEIAAEETEKKTVYAADDREAAADALKMLKDAYTKALKETSPEVSKEIQSRVGQRIRELENAVKAMEEMAMED